MFWVTIWGGLVLAWALEPLPGASPLLTSEEIEAINAAGMWQADPAFIEGKTSSLFRKSKARTIPTERIPEYNWGKLLDYVTLPASFDSRSQWPGCVHPIQSTEDCAGSWAISATDALSDRICIQQRTLVTLSPQYLIDCQSNASGCDGGTAVEAWTFLNSYITPSSTCVPFIGETAPCPGRCSNGSTITGYYAGAPSSYSSIQSIQAAIMQGGPIQACFLMYSDFLYYRSGIYIYSSGAYEGVECVKLIGWGPNYWVGAGSYGTGWGSSGYFYFGMGQAALELDNSGIAANPA